MELLTFTLLYGGAAAAVLFALLCGEAAMFADTPVAWLHWAITSAPCSAFEWAVVAACGSRGERWLDAAGTALCERRNPALQIVYVAILGVMYWMYSRDVFTMLPTRHVPAWHMYTGTGMLLLCVAVFLVASFSDPGFVTADNVAAHCAAAPYNDATNTRKTCSTCRRQRPARSKHCSACGGCVARFDHHCPWLNNCVGANNMRYFLLFLATNVALSAYGCGLAVALILDDMSARRMWSRKLVNYRTGRVVVFGADKGVAAQWIIANYGPQVMMVVLMAVAAAAMSAFLGYHMWLLRIGMTTNETIKWRDLRLALGEQLYGGMEDDTDAEGTATNSSGGNGGNDDRHTNSEEGGRIGAGAQRGWSLWRLWPFRRRRPARRRRRPRLAPADQMPPWIYDDGFWANLRAVIFPRRWRAARTAGMDLTKAFSGLQTVDRDGTEREPAAGEAAHADGTDSTSPDGIGADSRPAGAGRRMAASTIENHITRRHGHMVNGEVA